MKLKYLNEDARPSQIRIGMAIYDNHGYKILNDDDNKLIKDMLNDINPQGVVPRGQSFRPIKKKTVNGIGITVPMSGKAAGGAVPFVSLVLFGSNDEKMLTKAADRLMQNPDIDHQYKYGLAKVGKSL